MSGSLTSKAGALAGEMINAAERVRTGGGLLIEHGASAVKLARIDLESEAARIESVVLSMQLFALLLGLTLLFGGVYAIAASWGTPYRIEVIEAMPALFGVATFLAWRRLKYQFSLGKERFEATCAELDKTMTLLRSYL